MRAIGDMGKDHPRSRGEYNGGHLESSRTLGSSPLSRGIHAVEPGDYLFPGIIPALAGNTYAWSE